MLKITWLYCTIETRFNRRGLWGDTMRTLFVILLSGLFMLGFLNLPVNQVLAEPSPVSNYTTIDLSPIPQHLPYLVSTLREFNLPKMNNKFLGNPACFINIDDDPDLEIIRSSSKYLMCSEYSGPIKTVHWQQNLEAEFYVEQGEGAAFGLSEPLDLGLDNVSVVANSAAENGSNFRFWVLDPKTGNVLSTFDMPGGQDRNHDGIWDGAYCVIGSMDVPTESGPEKAIIMVCKVGFDIDKRGVYAVNPWTGEIHWSFVSGLGLLPPQCNIVDLDGDGHPEILVAGNSPSNMGEEQINGYSDSIPHLIALDNSGAIIWDKTLADEPAYSSIQIGDLDGDGSSEIVSLMDYTYSTQGAASVWNLNGQLIDYQEYDFPLVGCLLIPREGNSTKDDNLTRDVHLTSKISPTMDVITGDRSSTVYRLEMQANKLSIVRAGLHNNGLYLMGVIKLPENQNSAILTMDRLGQARILNKNLEIIAAFKEDKAIFHRKIIPTRKNNNPSFLMIGSQLGTISLKPNPDTAQALAFKRFISSPRRVGTIGIALGMFLAGLLWMLIRRRNKEAPTEALSIADPLTHLQERRLHLLEDLEVSNHGAMAPLRSLRRLLWMLDAVQSGVGVNPTLMARLNEIWQDCHDDALPRLTNILERARLADISDTLVSDALASINLINTNLNELKASNFTENSVAINLAALHQEEKSSEAMLQNLRRMVAEHFQAPLSAVVNKVLRANQEAIEENAVQIHKGLVASMAASGNSAHTVAEDLICRMDADELGFILDNLVDNACRAMSSSPTRNLRITWQAVNGFAKIEISDTGIGITTEDYQKVMESGYSTRPGGGLGLPKSQHLLRKYGGQLSVLKSAPGQGTTFSLVVPRS